MNDPNPYSTGPQGNQGESDPPLSPKASDVRREDEGQAGQRAQEPRRMPDPVGSERCCGTCLNDIGRSFHNAVTRNPCGSLAVAFVAGVLCGVLAARSDFH
jgi:hypothetical protein